MNMRMFLAVAVGVAIAGCGPKVATVDVAPAKVALSKKGDQVTLVATPKDAQGNPVAGAAVAFASSDPGVATVDAASGLVTAVKTGDATMTATSGQIKGEAKVTVSIPASISVAPGELKLEGIGAQANLTAKVLDEKGREIQMPLTWESADAKVATVNNGQVVGVAAGQTQVFAVAAAIRAPVNVTVVVPTVASVEVQNAKIAMKMGDQPVQLVATAKDADGKAIAGAAMTFTSANPKVVTVDDKGMVTAVGKGKAKVTAASGEKKADAEVTVK